MATAQIKRIVVDERGRRLLDRSARRALAAAVRQQCPDIPEDELERLVTGLQDVLWTDDRLPLSDQRSSLLVRLWAGLVSRFGALDTLPTADEGATQAHALALDTVRLAEDFLAALIRELETVVATSAGAALMPLWTVLAAGHQELAHAHTRASLNSLASDLLGALNSAREEQRQLARALMAAPAPDSGNEASDTVLSAVSALERKLDRELAALQRRSQDHQAAEAAGELALFRERVLRLPPIARRPIEKYFSMDGATVASLVAAVTDPESVPTQVLRSWVASPPPSLGTLDSPSRPAAWAALGELSAAYGLARESTLAFEAAVAGGVPRRGYFRARSAWAAFTADDLEDQDERTRMRVVPGDEDEPAMRLVQALYWATHPKEAPSDWRLRAGREIAAWDPRDEVDRDLRARVAATIHLSDQSRDESERYEAAASVLTDALAQGHLDDTAVVLARILVHMATAGRRSDRWGDLERAKTLALRARDSYRSARRDTRKAVEVATGAAALAGQPGEVIRLGSARQGEATVEEAADPEIFQRVLLAALQVDAPLAAQMAQQAETEFPDGFLRRWALAIVAGHETSSSTPVARIRLWQEALDAAKTDDERRQALQGLAFVGDDELPGLEDLVEPAMAAEWRARAALERGDPRQAIALLHPYRNAAPSAADALAHAYASVDELDAAVTTLTEAARRFDHDRLVVVAAMLCTQAGDHARAEALITSVLQTATTAWAGRAEALSILGELQARRGAWAEAIVSWQSALEADPRREGTRWNLAGALAHRGDHAEAWNVLTTAPKRTGSSGEPLDPNTPREAFLLLFLGVRFGDPVAIAERGLALIDDYQHDEEFTGRSLTLLIVAGGLDRQALGARPRADDRIPRDDQQLPPALLDRLHKAIDRFVDAHPDSPYLRRMTGSVEQLAEQMTALARARLRETEALGKLLLAVQRGEAPLGVLFEVASRPYALVVTTQMAGVLSATGGADEHRAGVDDALTVLGVEPIRRPGLSDTSPTGRALLTAALLPIHVAVVDAAALYSLAQLSDPLVELLTSGVHSLALPDEAYVDIVAARDTLALDSQGSWVIDPATGEGRPVALDPAVLERQRASMVRVAELADRCRREAVPSHSHPELDALTHPEAGSWLGTLRLAAATGAALWSDDVAVRTLGRHLGIPTFSTTALLEAHVELGRVTAQESEDAVCAWIRAGIGDFEPNAERLKRVASENAGSRGAVLSALTKPAWWADVPRAIHVCLDLGSRLATTDPRLLADLVYCGVLGSARSYLIDEAFSSVAALLTAVAMRDVGPMGDPARVLEAARTGIRESARDVPDLLVRVARHILRSLEPALGALLAADTLRALAAQLPQADREAINRVILDPGRPG